MKRPKQVLSKYREGDRVLVGRGGFGRPLVPAVVAKDWDNESLVMVIFEGKTKPVPRAASEIRHETKPAGPSLKVGRAPRSKASKAPARAALRAVPKPAAPLRSAPYLAFVRRHVCAHCKRGEDIHAHHWGEKGTHGLARKVSDYSTVPLCARCHRHVHDTGLLPELDQRTTFDVLRKSKAELLEEWIVTRRARAEERRDRAG